MNMKNARIAKTAREGRVPTLEQIRHVLCSMPAETEIERRDRALIAFTISRLIKQLRHRKPTLAKKRRRERRQLQFQWVSLRGRPAR
jgi:hypothetical protein